MDQDSTAYQCYQDQYVWVCANKTCLVGCVLLDQYDNWYPQIHFWVLDTLLNLVDVDWAMHAVDQLPTALAPKESPTFQDPLSM